MLPGRDGKYEIAWKERDETGPPCRWLPEAPEKAAREVWFRGEEKNY